MVLGSPYKLLDNQRGRKKPSRLFRQRESLIRSALDELAKEQSTCPYFIACFASLLGNLFKKKLEKFVLKMLDLIDPLTVRENLHYLQQV